MQKPMRTLILFFIVTFFLAACASTPPAPTLVPTMTSSPEPSSTPAPTKTATPTSTITPTGTVPPTLTATATELPPVTGPINFPANVNPLTGLVVADPTLLDRNPTMIKVANFPRSGRPHAGLSYADLVFEYYIGLGGSRFSAIFYGQNPSEVGPVRSARMIDAQLARMYNALFAFAGADSRVYERVTNVLGDYAITLSTTSCPAICRVVPNSINGVMAYPAEMTAFADEQLGIEPERPTLSGMFFNPLPPKSDLLGVKVTVKYATTTVSEWRYDAASGQYLRYIDSINPSSGALEIIPLVDRLTDQQLTADNVIVLFVYTQEIIPTLHDFELSDLQGGRAILFRDGQAYEITWRPTNLYQPLQFFDLNGNLIPLRPGQTWIHVIGQTSSQSSTPVGVWEFFNIVP